METVFITDIQNPSWKVHLDLTNLKIMEGGDRDKEGGKRFCLEVTYLNFTG